jgi:hypothetical protein
VGWEARGSAGWPPRHGNAAAWLLHLLARFITVEMESGGES